MSVSGTDTSESYHSSVSTIASNITEDTSPSLGDCKDMDMPVTPALSVTESSESPSLSSVATPSTPDDSMIVDVAMHPTDSKRVAPQAVASGVDEPRHPTPGGPNADAPKVKAKQRVVRSPASSVAEDMPSCVLLNTLHVTDIFDLPGLHPNGWGDKADSKAPRFRPPRLPNQINLRNLNIQQIKYASISDVILYGKGGVGDGVLAIAEM